MADMVAQPQKFDATKGVFDTLNTGLVSYFGYKTAKETSKTLANAPQGNTMIIVGGVVAIAVVGLIAIKSFT